MNKEPDLFSQPIIPTTAETLKQTGMKMALDHAEATAGKWGDRCYNLLIEYLKINKGIFMTEYFRQWTEGKIETVNGRAFGAVMTRACKNGLIRHCGYSQTTNVKAHRTPASTWQAL